MTTLTENPRNWEFLVSENNGDFSREQFTLISGQNCKAGTVLGKITASGKYTILNTGAADGSENAAAILGPATDASAADKRTAGIVGASGISVEVNGNLLTWPSGISGGDKTTAIAALAALGIKVR